jgi:hypothetical protein
MTTKKQITTKATMAGIYRGLRMLEVVVVIVAGGIAACPFFQGIDVAGVTQVAQPSKFTSPTQEEVNSTMSSPL